MAIGITNLELLTGESAKILEHLKDDKSIPHLAIN
jgi:hypothetical protein